MSVRAAGRRDADALADLVRRAVEDQARVAGQFRLRPDVDWNRLTIDKLRRRRAPILLAEIAGRPVGYMEVRIRGRRWWRRGYGTFDDIFVLEEHRREGIADLLVQTGLEWLRTRGIRRAMVGVWARNRKSLRFTESRGFKRIRVTMRIPLEGSRRFVAAEGVQCAEMDGETVLLGGDGEAYYGLTDVSARIWLLLARPRSLDELVETLTGEYEVDPERCREDTRELLAELVRRGLVRRDG